MTFLTLENISKIYPNGQLAVENFTLEVFEGELVVFVGPSGCGKSTLLRMIAGLEEINSGNIKIKNQIINKIDPSERNIAMVFQNYALYPHMTVFKNLSYGLKNRNFSKKEIFKKVSKVANLLNINNLLERKPSQLSGGQKQRVAMGRAIIRDPQVFLFDEPLSNLDSKLRNQVRLEIKKLQKRTAITSIFVTHDQIEAMTLADRLVVINEGKIEQIGTPNEIYRKPKTLFVAEFIGNYQMNFFEGKISNNQFICEHLEVKTELQNQDEVLLGIRPEDIFFNVEGNIKVKIEIIEELGANSLVYCVDEKGKNIMFIHDTSHYFETNQNILLSINSKNIHYFKMSDKKRLN